MYKRFITLLFIISLLILVSCDQEMNQEKIQINPKKIELPYYGAFIVTEGS